MLQLETVTVTVTAGSATQTAIATPVETAAAVETTAVATPDVTTPAVSSATICSTGRLTISFQPAGSALDFGSCTDPSIEFGPAFEGRKLREFTFKPVNKQEFPQGSALNGNIVTNAVCNVS